MKKKKVKMCFFVDNDCGSDVVGASERQIWKAGCAVF